MDIYVQRSCANAANRKKTAKKKKKNYQITNLLHKTFQQHKDTSFIFWEPLLLLI